MANNKRQPSQIRLQRYGQERFIFTVPKGKSNQIDVWKAFFRLDDLKAYGYGEEVQRMIYLARTILVVSAQSFFQKNKKEKTQAYKFVFMPNKRFSKVCEVAHVKRENFRKLVNLSLDGQIPKPARYDQFAQEEKRKQQT
ncbi:MAG: hypothetical protein GY793_08460 [Proteobacteria bacterium]|nr:hypothetical protein [Pseudomonadota bacterium]